MAVLYNTVIVHPGNDKALGARAHLEREREWVSGITGAYKKR